ncbi:MAG: hypothetical protein ACREAZ_12965 [Nitrososphaera sp.]
MSQKPQHGDFDQEQQKWYCSYWMSQEEWLDVHDYVPTLHGKEAGEDIDQE